MMEDELKELSDMELAQRFMQVLMEDESHTQYDDLEELRAQVIARWLYEQGYGLPGREDGKTI